jgi:hypothetical protein
MEKYFTTCRREHAAKPNMIFAARRTNGVARCWVGIGLREWSTPGAVGGARCETGHERVAQGRARAKLAGSAANPRVVSTLRVRCQGNMDSARCRDRPPDATRHRRRRYRSRRGRACRSREVRRRPISERALRPARARTATQCSLTRASTRDRDLAQLTIYNTYSVILAMFPGCEARRPDRAIAVRARRAPARSVTDKDPEWRNEAVFVRAEVETVTPTRGSHPSVRSSTSSSCSLARPGIEAAGRR